MQNSPQQNSGEPPAKRRRGRPAGAKNKTKHSAFLRPLVLEISAGGDIAEAVKILSCNLRGSVSVLTANGPVSSAVIKTPTLGGLEICGCYELVSMSSFFVEGAGEVSAAVAGFDGEVLGGVLVGPLVAAGKVVVVAGEIVGGKKEGFLEGELGRERKEGELGGEREENDDEWCRNWFGECENEMRRRFDLGTGSGVGPDGFFFA